MEPKFNLNRPPVTDEEINSHKDFGELVKKFKNESIQKARNDISFLKNKKVTYSAIIAGVAVVCTVTYFSVFKKEPPKETKHDKIVTLQNTKNTPDTKSNKAFIAPPISKIKVPYASYKVNAGKGGTIKHSSGSKIIIPKKSFINKQGEDIVGDVEIKYREFHNQADIIASGIPMTYDSAGIQSHLESAGMIDIKGYQNGEPVFINPKKVITVEFASEYPSDKYNMYMLDTVAQNWVYLNRDNSLKGQKAPDVMKGHEKQDPETIETPKTIALQKQIDEIPPKIEAEKVVYSKKVNQLPKATAPVKPSKATEGRPQFELDVNYREFPELAAFKNAIFEVGTENKNFSSKLADITWSSAQVSEGPVKGKNYLLTLTLGDRVEKLIVYPALTGADYDKALKAYESKFGDYKNLLAKREADEKKLKEEFEAKQKEYMAEMQRLNEEQVKERARFWKEQEAKLEEQFATIGNQQKVMRLFQVNSFNIYNSDCPNSMPKGASIDPVYMVNNGHITPTSIYLVCHNKNLVYSLNYGTLQYNPKEIYSLCVIAKGNKVYLFDKESFSGLAASKQNKIQLTELNADVTDVNSLKKAIGI
jgi:hypothetical protein